MPIFKSTYNIITKPDEDEVFETKWMDSNSVYLPPTKEWDYKREMRIEDVDIWEVLYEESGARGVYASWCPYAEFYLVTTGIDTKNNPRIINDFAYQDRIFEVFYGKNAAKNTFHFARQIGMNLPLHQYWIDDKDLWLYAE